MVRQKYNSIALRAGVRLSIHFISFTFSFRRIYEIGKFFEFSHCSHFTVFSRDFLFFFAILFFLFWFLKQNVSLSLSIYATFTFICLIPGDYDNETDDVDQNGIDNSNRNSDNDDGDDNVQQPTTNSDRPSIIDTKTSPIDARTDSSDNRINVQINTNEILGSEWQPTEQHRSTLTERPNQISIDSKSCDRNNGGCEQTCNMVPNDDNSGNVVECSCNEGFYLDADGGSKCVGKS